MVSEHWRPVPSLTGYEASDLGRVRFGPRQQVRTGTVGPCGTLTMAVNV